MDRPVGLNWGCGPVAAAGWINVDPAYADRADPPGLPVIMYSTEDVADGRFDGIVANHSLQCLCAHELDPAVAELHRVLRPGGRLRVLVPDVVSAFGAWERQQHNWPGFAAITEDWSLNRKFCHYLTWGGQNRSTFTFATLGELLERNGFVLAANWWKARYVDPGTHDWGWLAELDSRLGESLVLEAVASGAREGSNAP